MLRRLLQVPLFTLVILPLSPTTAAPQAIARAAVGGALGVAGGVGVTLATITARAHFQNEYLHAVEDLIHWQSTPMIIAPATGAFFGWSGEDELRGSFIGSVSGLVVGGGIGAGLGWLLSEEPDSPWAGGIIGGGLGLAIGGLLGGLLEWTDDDTDGQRPAVEVELRVPL